MTETGRRFSATSRAADADRQKLSLQLAGPAKAQVLVDGRLHVGRFKLDPVGIVGQPPRLGELARPRRGIAARRQRDADPVDHVGPRPHRRCHRSRIRTCAATRLGPRELVSTSSGSVQRLATRDGDFRSHRIAHLVPGGQDVAAVGTPSSRYRPSRSQTLRPGGRADDHESPSCA